MAPNSDTEGRPEGPVTRVAGPAPAREALIVEDSAVFADLLCTTLSARFPHLRCAWAASRQAAYGHLLTMRPDLAVLDIGLPDGDGLSLAHAVRRCNAAALIVVISVFDLPEYVEAARRHTADLFLSKSDWNQARFLALVERAIAA